MGSDPGVQELTACVCQADVCGGPCTAACAANGIDQDCLPCVEEAVQSTCEQQYLMCMVD
ncbi:MAG: hypothetical protein JRI68_18680 [Deltaproteobacteria bacterium]|nr:hypothetical protein [Deltaproteobacteria bacterium]